MASQFGPWATPIDAGSNPQLSAFWRRRLTMLVPTSQTSPVLSRRHLLWLGAALVLTMVLPSFHFVSADTAVISDDPDDADDPDKKATSTRAEAEPADRQSWTLTLPGGRKMHMSGGTYTTGGGAGQHEEMKKLIAEKKYEFVKTFESPDGVKQYVYRFRFSNGNRVATNFAMRLEDVASWEDYQQKQIQQRQQRQEKLNKSLAAGKFRLINLEVMQVHRCRDVESKQEFKIQRIPVADGKEVAFPRPDFSEIPASVKETSWQEHLREIREGTRELLGLETTNSYTYEVLLDDGSKTLFQYGGDRPLEKSQD